MKNADEKFLADLRVSPLGEKFAADMEIARLARRRNALRGWNAFAKTNARFIENLAAAQSEVAARRKAYEAAEAALIEAGSELYLATRAVDNLQLEEQRAEGAARGAVLRESNPRRQELLFNPLRQAIEEARRAPLLSDTTYSAGYFQSGLPVPEAHFATRPSILARISFIERALHLLEEHMFHIDDDDDTLTQIREAILAAAPRVDRLVAVPLTPGGGGPAADKETAAAVVAADQLAEQNFGVKLKEALNRD